MMTTTDDAVEINFDENEMTTNAMIAGGAKTEGEESGEGNASVLNLIRISIAVDQVADLIATRPRDMAVHHKQSE